MGAMQAPDSISPDLTVRQAATAWPACAPALERYPAARWGGKWSLQELGAFARAAGVDAADLLRELGEAARVPVRRQAAGRGRGGSPVPLILAAVALGVTAGAGWGVALLLRIAVAADYAAAPPASIHAHGLAQLWGWMVLFVLAVATHLLGQNTKHPAPAWLGRTAAGAIVAGVLVFFAGLFDATRRMLPQSAVVASVLLLAGALGFGAAVVWPVAGRGQRPQVWHGFVLAMVGWLWAWAGADLYLRISHVGGGPLNDPARGLLILLAVLGFGANAVYGFGIRLIPGLLNVARLRPGWFPAALVAHNVGLCLLLTPPQALKATGAAAMLAGCVAYLAGMGGLRSRPSRPIYGVDPRGHVLIRIAFFWLLAGLAMVLVHQLFPGLPHAYGGAWRHALTVGFITTMILGVGQRVVPVFIKQPLALNGLMLAGAALIVLGNAGRVGLELATAGGWRWAFRLMGLTGLLELSALVLFALNLVLTALARRRTYSPEQPLAPATRVRDAVNARPALQQRLREIGVNMFDNAAFIAPSLTFGALALGEGRPPEQFLADLGADPGPGDAPADDARPRGPRADEAGQSSARSTRPPW
jgi:hypothetical protein